MIRKLLQQCHNKDGSKLKGHEIITTRLNEWGPESDSGLDNTVKNIFWG